VKGLLSGAARFLRIRSIYGLALLAFMGAGAMLQSYFALKFWGSWGEPAERWVWQFGGVACAWAVMILLTAASELGVRREAFVARWLLRFVATLFLLFNLTCDIGAVEAHTAADDQVRSIARAEFARARGVIGESRGRIDRLRNDLDAQRLPRNAAAIEARMEALQARIEARERIADAAPGAYYEEKGRLATALGWAQELERLETARASAQATIERYGEQPDTTRPQIAAFRDAFALLGFRVNERTIGLAFAAAFCVLIQLGVTAASIASPFLTIELDSPPAGTAPKSDPPPAPPLLQTGPLVSNEKIVRIPPKRSRRPAQPKVQGASWDETRRLIQPN
jgi:hypothetical protein